jgi:hypothetical protein
MAHLRNPRNRNDRLMVYTHTHTHTHTNQYVKKNILQTEKLQQIEQI